MVGVLTFLTSVAIGLDKNHGLAVWRMFFDDDFVDEHSDRTSAKVTLLPTLKRSNEVDVRPSAQAPSSTVGTKRRFIFKLLNWVSVRMPPRACKPGASALR